ADSILGRVSLIMSLSFIAVVYGKWRTANRKRFLRFTIYDLPFTGFSRQTRVPIPDSLITTREMLPGVRMLKTMIGRLLSIQSEIAEASITFNCFSRTSR